MIFPVHISYRTIIYAANDDNDVGHALYSCAMHCVPMNCVTLVSLIPNINKKILRAFWDSCFITEDLLKTLEALLPLLHAFLVDAVIINFRKRMPMRLW